MKFVVVNGRTPRTRSFCAQCCESIGESYLRDIAAQLVYCSHKCYVDLSFRYTQGALATQPWENGPPCEPALGY